MIPETLEQLNIARQALTKAYGMTSLSDQAPQAVVDRLVQNALNTAVNALDTARHIIREKNRLNVLELRVNAIENRLGPEPWLDARMPNCGIPEED